MFLKLNTLINCLIKNKYYGQNNLFVMKSMRKLNVLLQNLVRMKHLEIYILKVIKKLMSRKLMDQLN